jgi:hypothetical protein
MRLGGLQGLGLFTVGDRDACALDDCVHVEISLKINGLCVTAIHLLLITGWMLEQ